MRMNRDDPERELAVQWRPDGLQAQIRVVAPGMSRSASESARLLLASPTGVAWVGVAGILSVAFVAGIDSQAPVAIMPVFALVVVAGSMVLLQGGAAPRRVLTIVGSRLTIEGEGSWDLRSCRRVDAWKYSLGVFGLDGRPLRTVLLEHDPAVVAWLAEQLNRGIPDPTSKTAEAESRQARRELDALVGSTGRPGDR